MDVQAVFDELHKLAFSTEAQSAKYVAEDQGVQNKIKAVAQELGSLSDQELQRICRMPVVMQKALRKEVQKQHDDAFEKYFHRLVRKQG